MERNKLIFAPLCLILCWMLPVDSKKISYIFSLQDANQVIPLNMVEDAVDDMYFGCNETMTEMIKDKYFKSEMKNSQFANVWKKAERCANKKLEPINKGEEALTKEHKQAICVYTSDNQKFYGIFNGAVRTNRKLYGKSFAFHSLHFWLTSAVKILSNNKKCHTTYRRTNLVLSGNVNDIIRFGFFASSSKRTDLTKFGSKTCFQIETCFGAFLKKYPSLKDIEQEVLIPPYEMFKITKKLENKYKEHLSDCETVYYLKSAGFQSNINCHVAKMHN